MPQPSRPPLAQDEQRAVIINTLKQVARTLATYTLATTDMTEAQDTSTDAVSASRSTARWYPQEVDALVTYLHVHRAERADGGGFRENTFHAASQAIRHLHVSGKIKDAKCIATKWAAVRPPSPIHPISTDKHSTKLKATYNAIQTYRSKSGVHWDDEHGGNIQGAVATATWDEYMSRKVRIPSTLVSTHAHDIQGNKHMKEFRNKGWPYLAMVEEIYPQGGATGGGAFRGKVAPSIHTIPDFTTEPNTGLFPSSISVAADNINSTAADTISTSLATTSLGDPQGNEDLVSDLDCAVLQQGVSSTLAALKAPSPIVPLGGAVAPAAAGHAQVTQSSGLRGKNVKRSFGTMSPDESDNSSATPFPLSSLQAPVSTATSSLPSSKRSRTGNSAQTGQPSQSVALISVSNAIQRLNDQLDTNFVDSAAKVAQAIPLIYADTVCPPVHTRFASQYLTLHPNAAVVYMSLPNADARRQYLKDLFDESGKAGSTMD